MKISVRRLFFALASAGLFFTFMTGCSDSKTPSQGSSQQLALRTEVFHPPGQPFFDLQVVNLNQPVLLVFWATWCPSCLEEVPVLNDLAKQYDGKMALVSVNVQEEATEVQKFLTQNKVDYPVVLDVSGEISERFDVSAVPSVLLLAKGGEILYYGFRLPDRGKIEAVLKASFNDLEHI